MVLPTLPARRLTFIVALSSIAYAALWLVDTGLRGEHALDVVVAFLLLPAILLWLMHERPELGAMDVYLAAGVVVYLPLALWVVAYIPSHMEFFRGWAQLDEGPTSIAFHATTVGLNVAAVDFFCRRVVQLGASRIWGDRWGLVLATTAWMLGHITEAIWLDDLMGLASAVAFITIAGVATGFVYMRGRNVVGLMLGHALLNVIVVASTALMTG